MAKRNIMRAFKIDEISAVDKPAQAGARVVIMKRDDGRVEDEGLPAVNKRLLLTTSIDGHSHLLDDSEQGGTTSYQTAESDEYGHDHPWVVNTDGTIEIGESSGHTHTLSSTSFNFQSKRDDDPHPPKGDNVTKQEDIDMDALKELQKKFDELQKELEANATELAKAKAEATLTDDQRAYYGKMGDTDKVTYLAKSADDRQAEIVKSQADDDVVYTGDDGTTYHKSDDSRLVKLAKKADEDSRIAKEEREKSQAVVLAKRAGDELSHLPGDEKVKVEILKALENGIKDEDTRKAAYELLKAGNTGVEKAFETLGNGKNSAAVGSAQDQLNTLANKGCFS